MNRLFVTFMLTLLTVTVSAAPSRKVIDDGGSGPYKAEAVSEASLPGFVVYRPCDMSAAVTQEGPLPFLYLPTERATTHRCLMNVCLMTLPPTGIL